MNYTMLFALITTLVLFTTPKSYAGFGDHLKAQLQKELEKKKAEMEAKKAQEKKAPPAQAKKPAPKPTPKKATPAPAKTVKKPTPQPTKTAAKTAPPAKASAGMVPPTADKNSFPNTPMKTITTNFDFKVKRLLMRYNAMRALASQKDELLTDATIRVRPYRQSNWIVNEKVKLKKSGSGKKTTYSLKMNKKVKLEAPALYEVQISIPTKNGKFIKYERATVVTKRRTLFSASGSDFKYAANENVKWPDKGSSISPSVSLAVKLNRKQLKDLAKYGDELVLDDKKNVTVNIEFLDPASKAVVGTYALKLNPTGSKGHSGGMIKDLKEGQELLYRMSVKTKKGHEFAHRGRTTVNTEKNPTPNDSGALIRINGGLGNYTVLNYEI